MHTNTNIEGMTLLEATLTIECPDASTTERKQIEAWSYIAHTRAWTHLQGFYGRTVHDLIGRDIIDHDGNILVDFDDEGNMVF